MQFRVFVQSAHSQTAERLLLTLSVTRIIDLGFITHVGKTSKGGCKDGEQNVDACSTHAWAIVALNSPRLNPPTLSICLNCPRDPPGIVRLEIVQSPTGRGSIRTISACLAAPNLLTKAPGLNSTHPEVYEARGLVDYNGGEREGSVSLDNGRCRMELHEAFTACLVYHTVGVNGGEEAWEPALELKPYSETGLGDTEIDRDNNFVDPNRPPVRQTSETENSAKIYVPLGLARS
ncbi:hypothetical protein RRG08_035496 [Elysia crispata]|uniref:Uncharacterized protein n=1 Tax=Elysia crispata TaxID=231223 RepID=A0AAE1AQC1_9GAST|nr:hypothetical protein RRG08_035496 [Elysia crispata]